MDRGLAFQRDGQLEAAIMDFDDAVHLNDRLADACPTIWNWLAGKTWISTMESSVPGKVAKIEANDREKGNHPGSLTSLPASPVPAAYRRFGKCGSPLQARRCASRAEAMGRGDRRVWRSDPFEPEPDPGVHRPWQGARGTTRIPRRGRRL